MTMLIQKKIGQILVDSGKITEGQLTAALQSQKESGHLLGEQLVRSGYLGSEMDLISALSEQLHLEIIEPSSVEINEDVIKNFTETFLIENNVIPYDVVDGVLYILSSDPTRSHVEDIARRFYPEIRYKLAVSSKIESKLKNYLNESSIINDLKLTEGQLDAIETLGKSSSVVALVDAIIQDAINARSSDIQISVLNDRLFVRYKANQNMRTVKEMRPEIFPVIASRIKYISSMDISNTRLPQDGNFFYSYAGENYDIRVSTFPLLQHEAVSLRILYRNSLPSSLDKLGFNTQVLKRYRDHINSQEGLILLTGPAGHGKTTTLCTSIMELREKYKESKNIVTLENPIEYILPGVLQSPINVKRQYTFSEGLRAILRQVPNIVMLGEIRDEPTASIALRAGYSGHLIFSTVHSRDAVGAIFYLKQLGVLATDLINALTCVLNQRLVPKNCPECRERREILPSDTDIFPELTGLFVSSGCSYCNYTGKKGVVLIQELLSITDHVRELIIENKSMFEIKRNLTQNELYSMKESLSFALNAGDISIVDATSLLK